MTALTRRTLLGGAAAGTAIALGGGPAQGAGLPGAVVDCAVVGAGLSGLATARRLVAAGKRVVVLEARDRPGGRVQNVATRSGAYEIDGGAEFTGPTQDHIQALADEHAVRTVATYNEGENLYRRGTTTTRYPAALGLPVDLGTPEAAAGLAALQAAASTLTPGRPWEHPLATHWDSMTYRQWIEQTVRDESARLQLSLICSATLSVRPDEISALFMFGYVAAAGNEANPGTALRLVSVSGGAQERYFDGGAALVPLRMAADLAADIVYGAPVTSIDTRGTTAVVTTARGRVRARRVVVATSPAIAGRISYPAGLSEARRQLHASVRMGSIGKFQGVYPVPFWREQGLSGQVIGDGAPIDVTFESTSQGRHFLMGFLSADNMRRLDGASEDRLVEECLRILADYFGPRVRGDLLDVGFKRWDTDPWSRGGPTGVCGPRVLTRWGPALREPLGALHWAGTEAATYWQGYMDGAVSSGYRAADEVLAALG